MAAFALEEFERLAESLARAHGWAEWQYVVGHRPGRGLVGLYDEDFPNLTSLDLWEDLQDAPIEDPARKRSLSLLLGSAHVEGRTRDEAVRSTRFLAASTLRFEDEDIPWRAAPDRWPLLGDVPRRHTLHEAWREQMRSGLTPTLEAWQPALQRTIAPLGAGDWNTLWGSLHGFEMAQVRRLGDSLLSASAEVYGHALGVYLGQLGLPIDDAWPADADYAFRAARFDHAFVARNRLPVVIGTFRELGVDIESQTGLRLDAGSATPGVHVLPINVPGEVRVVQRLIGGYLDYQRTLFGLGAAQSFVQVDASLPFFQRWLGDATPTRGYGLLMSQLTLDRTWLGERLGFVASEDFRVVAHLARLYRVRLLAASIAYEERLWALEPGSSLAADFSDTLTEATRIRHFSEPYLLSLLHAPWTALDNAVELRAEVFAAQVRHFLRREFDEEWWRDPRAGRFVVQELWRQGRRYSAEELLGFMGYEGFDGAPLWSEISEVLSPL